MKIIVTEKGRDIQNEILKEGNYKIILPKLQAKTNIMERSATLFNNTPVSKPQTSRANSRKLSKRKPPVLQLAEICNYGLKNVLLTNNTFLSQEDSNLQSLSNSRWNQSKKTSPINSEIFFESPNNKEENYITSLLKDINSPEKMELTKNTFNNNINKKPESPYKEQFNKRNTIFKDNITLRQRPEIQDTLKKALSSTRLITQYDKFGIDNSNVKQFEIKINRFCDKYVRDQTQYNSLVDNIRERVEMKKLKSSQNLTNYRNNKKNLLEESQIIFNENNHINEGYKQRKKEKLREYMFRKYKETWKSSQADRYLSGEPPKMNKMIQENYITNLNE